MCVSPPLYSPFRFDNERKTRLFFLLSICVSQAYRLVVPVKTLHIRSDDIDEITNAYGFLSTIHFI